MEQDADFNTIYFERKGTNVKRFLEEAIPVACLGLHFFKPFHDVFVQCLVGNGPFDATLRVRGYPGINIPETKIKVEVTTTETDDSTMRGQSVARHGFRWSSGRIKRVGREIESEPEIVDVDEQAEQWITLAFNRVLDKLKKTSGSDTAILVYMDTYQPLDFCFREKLISTTEDYIRKEEPQVYGIYYCHSVEFLVDGLARHDVW
jgi:hypothetical protein